VTDRTNCNKPFLHSVCLLASVISFIRSSAVGCRLSTVHSWLLLSVCLEIPQTDSDAVERGVNYELDRLCLSG
jgi:hypothetical protein